MLTVAFLDLGMASKTRTLPIPASVHKRFPAVESGLDHLTDRISGQILDRAIVPGRAIDLMLYHNEVDRTWCMQLAARIREERSGNHNLAPELATMKFSSPAEILAEAGKCLGTSRFFGLVVSKRMLREDWPVLEKLVSALSDLNLAKGRLLPILKENVTMPPVLRMTEWVDFRDGDRFEGNVCDLLTHLREGISSSEGSPQVGTPSGPEASTGSGWKTKALFTGAKNLKERIISNLFPIVEFPKEIFSAGSRFQTESEVLEACGGPGPLPFVLKGSRLYALEPLNENSVFMPALKENCNSSPLQFSEWLSNSERVPWAIELLNRLLRYHAWKRGMRFDEAQCLFYFTRSKPKKLWWEIGGKTIQREVTAPFTKWIPFEGFGRAEVQCGWRHEAVRAGFVQALGTLFLRLEPAWLLTELDGKTPSTTGPVGPLEPFPQYQEENGDVLRTLRFWSAVLAKGHRELRVDTGTNPIRVRLTPVSGASPCLFSNDQMDFDSLATMDVDAAQLIPELSPIEE